MSSLYSTHHILTHEYGKKFKQKMTKSEIKKEKTNPHSSSCVSKVVVHFFFLLFHPRPKRVIGGRDIFKIYIIMSLFCYCHCSV